MTIGTCVFICQVCYHYLCYVLYRALSYWVGKETLSAVGGPPVHPTTTVQLTCMVYFRFS